MKAIEIQPMTLDDIDNLFEKHGGIEDIINISESTLEPNYDILYEDDNIRIVSTGYCLMPADNKFTLVELKNIQIWDAVMETRESEDDEYETSCSVVYIQIGEDWYYETESYISVAIHNYFNIDMAIIDRMQFNICV